MTTVPRRSTAMIAILATLALLPFSASALERVGPVNPINGFPLWFQDSTGITLDLCAPTTADESPWCNMALDAGVTIPEQFPDNWSVEHFYWMGEAEITGAVTAGLIMGVESTFSTDAADPGAQITFGRIRWDIEELPAGTYRVYTPFIVKEFVHAADGDDFRYVEDLGANCAVGAFDCTLDSNITRFLLPSATAGGPESVTPFLPFGPTGRRYIANPAVPVTVTGSSLPRFTPADGVERDSNIFLIERVRNAAGEPAPLVLGETNLFSIMGRLFNGDVAADVKVDRASYASDGAGNQVDIYATGSPRLPPRFPGGTIGVPQFPEIAFFMDGCGGDVDEPATSPGGTPIPLAQNGSVFWANEEPTTVPAALCVEKTLPGQNPTYERVDPLGDQVFVTQAQYNPLTQTLVVQASSSDLFLSELTLAQIGDVGPTPLVNGVATVSNLVAPPSVVEVLSTQQGIGTKEVTTRVVTPLTPPAATAVTMTSDLGSPQPVGTPVTFEAQGEGSTPGAYRYRFWLFTNNEWRIVQDYSADNTWTLPGTTAAGTYQVSVHVRTSADVFADAFLDPVVVFQIGQPPPPPAPATAVTMTSDLDSPQAAGTPVTFEAQGEGSTPGAYRYRFWLFSDNEWRIVQDYSADNTWTMPGSTPAGTYQVSVHVRTGEEVFADAFLDPIVTYVLQQPQ